MKRYRNLETNQFVIIDRDEESSVTFYPEGWGFLHRLPAEVFYQHHVEDDSEPQFQRELISADWMEACFFAYSKGVRWNGWAVPHFTFEQMMEITKLMPDAVRVVDGIPDQPARFQEYDFNEEEWVDVPRVDILFPDGPIDTYRLGNGWCWEVVEFPYGNEEGTLCDNRNQGEEDASAE